MDQAAVRYWLFTLLPSKRIKTQEHSFILFFPRTIHHGTFGLTFLSRYKKLTKKIKTAE